MACPAVVRASDLAAQIGASDCEVLGDGLLAQPINAITSLAYVAVGALVLLVARRRERLALDAWVYAGLLAAIGLGSVAFHGPQPTGSRLVHDLPITLLLAYMVAADVDLLRRGRPSRWVLFGPAAVVATVVTIIDVEIGTVLTGLAVLALVVCEVLIFRRDLRSLAGGRVSAAVSVIVVTSVAAATWMLGRTDSPVCDPDGAVQLHAVWHLLSASVFVVWWVIATSSPDDVSAAPLTAAPSAR